MHDVKRDAQLAEWIRVAPEAEALHYRGVVMWGVSINLDDETQPPRALFGDEAAAKAYATLLDTREWLVAPYVLSIAGRNNCDAPKVEQ